MSLTILLGIISVGILIFIHELGHFLAARMAGIKVEVFSIGWGRGLISFRWKETKIQLGWIPFGGYCKMAGELPSETTQEEPGNYYSSAPIKRIAVGFSGPVANYVLAVVLFILIALIGYDIYTYSNRIVLVKEPLGFSSGITPAMKAGLKDGDVILEINGRKISHWDEITEVISRSPLKPLKMKVLRDNRVIELTIVPEIDRETGRGLIGIYPWVEPVVGKVVEGGPADRAGFKEGDIIVSVDGKKIRNQIEFYEAIKGKSYYTVNVVVNRNGNLLTLKLVPEKVEEFDSPGFFFKQIKVRTPSYPFPDAVLKGVDKSVEALVDTIRGIGLLVSGKIKARTAIAGPAKLIYLSGVIAREGIVYFFQVMGYISIAFFIINLVPFPALDGSHITIALYEMITRRKPNLQLVHRIQTFGFLFLLVLLVFVTINDISSFFK